MEQSAIFHKLLGDHRRAGAIKGRVTFATFLGNGYWHWPAAEERTIRTARIHIKPKAKGHITSLQPNGS